MTDIAFFPARTLRALAVAGALGLAVTPITAATSFAAPGTIKIVQPGQTTENTRANAPHIEGCSFDVRLEGPDPGMYEVTFMGQPPTPDMPDVQGQPTITVGEEDEYVAETYLLVDNGAEPHPQQGFHIKVDVTDSEDESTVSSKVFWVECDFDTPDDEESPEPQASTPAPQASTPAAQASTPAPQASGSAKPSAQASVPGTVNSGIDGGNGGLVALGLGGIAVAGLATLGLRKRTRA